MNKYVIAVLYPHSYKIWMEQVEANSKLEALVSFFEAEDYSNASTLISDYEADGYSITIIELNNHARAGRSGSGLQTQLAQFDSVARVQ